MNLIAFEIAIVFALILMNGVFAMTELAMMTANQVRLQNAANAGSRRARAALNLKATPDKFLSAVQIGITLIGVLSGAFAGATLAKSLGAALDRVPILAGNGEAAAVGLVVLAITFLSLVFGELVPKQVAIRNPEGVATLMAIPMTQIAKIASPFVWVLSTSSNAVLKALRLRGYSDSRVTEEEVRVIVSLAHDQGLLEEAEHEMIQRTVKLGDRRVSSLMTHRGDVVWLNADEPVEKLLNQMAEAPYHTFPLCKGSLQSLIGIVSVRDVWSRHEKGQLINLEEIATEPTYILGSVSALRLLDSFRDNREGLIVVVDEHGSIDGVVTATDLLEALVGGLSVSEEEPEILEREDGSWLVEGSLSVEELEDHFAHDFRKEVGSSQIQTVAGLVIEASGEVPRLGLIVKVGPYKFEVVDMDRQRVDKVIVSRDSDLG